MDDDAFRTNTKFVKYADEEEMKAAYEKEKRAKEAEAAEDEALNVLDEQGVDDQGEEKVSGWDLAVEDAVDLLD